MDIEGTTTPIAFVHRALFAYARAALPGLLRDRAHEPAIAAAIAAIADVAPGCDPLAQCLTWMDQDAKVTPLKALQGIAWADGYADGSLQGELYPDVAAALRAWHAAGVRLAVYSSGSQAAQRLIFGHTPDGDLCVLFSAFLDTRIGGKREVSSYATAASSLETVPTRMLFLSDVEAELDAAAGAGLLTCQLVRAADATVAGTRHPVAADFGAVALRFGLPQA
ncbi:acireductone synthase [Lichenicoccus sp.]|uniref:acireductone synthase n=1 Tax=Lichenicoccus sp. TaxID=2781899 RepID=UPI003D0E7AE4